MSLIDDCLTRMSRMAGLIFLPSFISVKCRCGPVLRPFGVFALFHSVFLRYFRCICFTRYMVPRMVRTRVLAHLEKQKKILLCRRENLILPVVGNQFGYFLLVKPISLALVYGIHRLVILYAIAASMHEIPSFLSISATLLNEKFVLPERMRLTY